MYELVAVNRLNVKDQRRVRFYNQEDWERAKEDAEVLRKENPLTYYVLFVWVSNFCRILTWHTL